MMQDIVPFRQFVLKVHSRCDLACNHCYIYEHSDQSWRGRPKDGISSETAAFAARRIAEHAAAHRLADVHVILHGGEPLLLGARRTREVLEVMSREISPVTSLVLRMHTNAVLLDDEYLELLDEYDVKVGVSLDGGRAANDLHRLDRRGQSSYERVVAALALLRRPAYRHLYSGLLCTIDLENDPVEAYRALVDQEPPRIDFLLPHSTWENQPPGLAVRRDPGDPWAGPAPYAQWLGEIFEAWDRGGRPVPVRTFDSVLAALHGRPSGTESLGLVPADLLVIETDGTLEQADSLKTAFDGAPATGFDVVHNTLDEAAAHAGILARQQGLDGLCATCRACPVAAVCGGGLYAHRYDTKSGFDNPSVFCADLFGLIGQIRAAEAGPGRAGAALKAADARTTTGNNAHATTATTSGGIMIITGDPEPTASAHVLTRADFDALASGYGGAGAVGALAETQRSIRRDLLARMAGVGPQDDRVFTTAWDRLAALDSDRPDAVDEALAHPYVRVWAVRCLEDPDVGRKSGDAAYLASITASAYLRAGFPVSLAVPVRDGLVHVPGFGSLSAPGGREAVLEVLSGQGIAVSVGGRTWKIDLAEPEPGLPWMPVRRLDAGGLGVDLEDLDPYRDCHRSEAPRQTAAEIENWQASFPAAVAFIDEFLPSYAPALRAGLTTVMPMVAPTDGTYRSASARHAFGAVGAALPDDPALLGLLLVHEFQHVKLGAVLDLCDLFDAADVAPRHYAPWRPDPRPLEGLLQGTYAHIAVTEFWRVRRLGLSGDAADAADAHFARWRAHTAEAVDQLLGSGSLTALGTQLARAMGETLAPWLDEPVGAGALIAAQRSAAEHRAGFEERLKAMR